MQNPRLRFVGAIVALLALSLTLSACTSSSDPKKAKPHPAVVTLSNGTDTPIYQCGSTFDSFVVVSNGGPQSHYGTTVDASDDEVHPNAKTYPQTKVRMTFKGKTLRAQYMIVHLFSGPTKHINDKTAVVKVNAQMFKHGITLHVRDFGKGLIPLVEFCVKP